MLRKIRIALATLFFVGITLLFVGIGQTWWGWMAKLQFLPSALALNFAMIAFLLLLTFAFGRVYCSVICPMGVFQDFILWIRRAGGKRLKKRKDFSYVREHVWVRYGTLVLAIISLFVSGQMLIAFIAPYSAYGRMVRSVTGGALTLPLLLTGLVTLVVIVLCAWLWGREYCNTICPVGTTLSLVSRFRSSARLSMRTNARTASSASAAARPPASMSRTTRSITRAAWTASTAWTAASLTRCTTASWG
jgi:hypothetical protein